MNAIIGATIRRMTEDIFGFPKLEPYPIASFDFSNLKIPDRSASGLLEELDMVVTAWRKQAPPDAQVVIHAILASGAVIEARDFSEAGPNGIAITGRLSDGSDCLVLTHQGSLQLLCRVVKVENPKERYSIGFRYEGKQSG